MSEGSPQQEISNSMRWQRRLIRPLGLALIRIFYRIRTTNAEVIPAEGGALLLPNHVTFADAFFIAGACRRPVRFVMDDAFMAHPAIRWFCTIFDTVTIRKDQSREAIRITIDAINQGDVVCFFPEGQLSRTGTLNEIKRGVELIARKAEAPLIPLWMDGAWGSVFSFEHNVFFRKRPYRMPHPLFVAFGDPVPAASATQEEIRTALMKTAACAIKVRFPDGTTAEEYNGHQIGQLNALWWREPFALDEGLGARRPFEAFSEGFGCPVRPEEECTRWVGGRRMRESIKGRTFREGTDFYDFSPQAMEPVERPGLRHFPCLAIAGLVVAMSMPDPPMPKAGGTPQKGSKPGSWGKLLPGWFIEGALVKGPACPHGLPLPDGATLDADGFLVTG